MLTHPMLNIQILFTNYDITTDFLNLAFCSEHFISIKHRILETFNINKKNKFFKESSHSFNDFFGRYKHIVEKFSVFCIHVAKDGIAS